MKARACLGAALLIAAGCTRNMEEQPNPRGLDPSGVFADGRSVRPLPAGVVPQAQPAPSSPFQTGEREGRLLERVPLPLTSALLERGRGRFAIYCAPCHGDDGYGRGIVVRRGFPQPPSYHDDRLRQAPAGYLFQVMTRGYGAMYGYADRLDARDRWAVVAYIRALQRSQHGTLADLPPAERARLQAP